MVNGLQKANDLDWLTEYGAGLERTVGTYRLFIYTLNGVVRHK